MILGATGLTPGFEKDIEEAVREQCIASCISVADEVRFSSPTTAYVDFPYYEACRDFMQATAGTLRVKHRSFRLQHSSAAPPRERPAPPPRKDEDSVGGGDAAPWDIPSDTLMVRQIGEFDEWTVKKAFKQLVPSVRGVRILIDRQTRKPKGFGFVTFPSVGEAESALAKFNAAGAVIEGRKVLVGFAKPQSPEQMLENDLIYRHERQTVETQATPALNGINGDMWASYLSHFATEQERQKQETERKQEEARLLATKRREEIEQRAAQQAAAQAAQQAAQEVLSQAPPGDSEGGFLFPAAESGWSGPPGGWPAA